MKPDWDKLMSKWNKSKRGENTLIADVDCTAEGKDLCETHGVQGFPTLKWGDPNALEDYSGGRDFEALKTFAKDNLKPLCGPANLDLCDDEKKAQIAELQALSADDLNKQIEEKQAAIKAADKHFETEVEGLQKRYKELQEEKEQKSKEIKESGLGLMLSVRAAKPQGKEEL